MKFVSTDREKILYADKKLNKNNYLKMKLVAMVGLEPTTPAL